MTQKTENNTLTCGDDCTGRIHQTVENIADQIRDRNGLDDIIPWITDQHDAFLELYRQESSSKTIEFQKREHQKNPMDKHRDKPTLFGPIHWHPSMRL